MYLRNAGIDIRNYMALRPQNNTNR
jgi:hypothetical protein